MRKKKIYFEVVSILGKKIQVTTDYWKKIINIKHPNMEGKEKDVKNCLKNPDEVRISKSDTQVYLYYKLIKEHYICVVVKHLNASGFIITTYQPDKIKEGEIIWKR